MSQDRITGEMMNVTRMAVTGFDWSTRRVERFHRLISDFAAQCRTQGADSARTYEFVRTLGQEAGETVNGALFLVTVVRYLPRN